ncbi:MAG: hypothetical protein GXO32_07945 [Crenarchaeota archaeon]|nr:hypothetical protein [Thermoproteota archaeon]
MGSEGIEKLESASAEEQSLHHHAEEPEPSWRSARAIDLGELVFGRSLSRFLSDVMSPKLVIAWRPRDSRYSYALFLARVLRDAYRLVHGSLPAARFLQCASDLGTRLSWTPVQGSIVVVELPSDASRCFECRVRLEERLREFVSQGPGFLVLYVDRSNEGFVESLVSSVFNDVNCPDVIEVGVDESRPVESYLRVVAAYSGFIDFEEFDSVKSIDSLSMYLEAAFRRTLLDLVMNDPQVRDVATPCSDNEVIDRMLLRALALKHVSSREGRSRVLTCYRVARGFDVDIYDRERDEGIYIEVLHGARFVESRIRYVASTLLGSFSRASIVIPNSYLLLFSSRIIASLRDVTRWGGRIELLGVDVSRLRLATYSEIARAVSSE